jgi:hypothetical protein
MHLKNVVNYELKTMSDKIAECLYYRAWASFLRRAEDFCINYSFLMKQKKEEPDSFKIFTSNDFDRILMMERFYKTKQFLCFRDTDPVLSAVPPPILENTKETHRELVRKLYEARAQTLVPYTSEIEFVCPEFPVEFGNIDLVIHSKNTAYAVEVKTDPADHAIIGQVLKYYIGLSLNLCHKFYNDVKLITICPGYDSASIWGLKQMGVQTLLLNPDNLKVSKIS